MIRKAWRRLRRAHHDQRGANMFITIAIMFGLLLLVPIFVDLASLHFSHRISQTGADTAAHAAAVEYALQNGEPYSYSQSFPGDCGESPEVVAQRYLDEVVEYNARRGSYGFRMAYRQAVRYAGYHQSELVRLDPRYPSHTAPRTCQYPAGVQICALEFYAETRRPVPLVYRDFYGGDRGAPAKATAEVYMNPARPPELLGPFRCADGELRYDISFHWIVRLIDTAR